MQLFLFVNTDLLGHVLYNFTVLVGHILGPILDEVTVLVRHHLVHVLVKVTVLVGHLLGRCMTYYWREDTDKESPILPSSHLQKP